MCHPLASSLGSKKGAPLLSFGQLSSVLPIHPLLRRGYVLAALLRRGYVLTALLRHGYVLAALLRRGYVLATLLRRGYVLMNLQSYSI